MKKQSDFSRLMSYAGRYRVFTYASWVLSAISALTALVPFLYIWKILRDVLNAAPNYAQAVNIPHYGWMAVLFAVLSYLIYIAALMCSHLSAFRVATNLRLAVSEHLAVLPLGFAETFGSGKLRKIIHESTGAAETYLAHQLPDQYNAIATPVGLLVLLLAFDWRLGLLSLAPVVLAFLIMATMTGKRMVEKMRQYGNALEAMSNEAVEYVRGIPVVKTFGQSVFSFKNALYLRVLGAASGVSHADFGQSRGFGAGFDLPEADEGDGKRGDRQHGRHQEASMRSHVIDEDTRDG